MLLGRLYIKPFTRQLFVAVDKDDIKCLTTETVQYLRDIEKSDLIMRKGRLRLAQPYFGERNIVCTKEVLDKWRTSE